MIKKFEYDFEKLDVYQKTLSLIDEIFKIVNNLPNEYKYSIGNNLIRAGLSVANNIAEGNDKTSNKERNRFLSISSDSARECVSVFIILKKQNILEEDKFWRLKNLTREITSMLRGLKRYNS